jgi:hypothetical protein
LKADKEKTRKENKDVQREAEISVQVHSLNGWKQSGNKENNSSDDVQISER